MATFALHGVGKMPHKLTQPIETELKLAMTEEGVRRLTADERFQPPGAVPPEQRRLVATYFDTADQALARQGMAPRVRHDGSVGAPSGSLRTRAKPIVTSNSKDAQK